MKNVGLYHSIARLNFHQHCLLFGISSINTTLVLYFIFRFSSICQLFRRIFFLIAVCHMVTLVEASKMNQRQISKNSTILLSINIVEVVHCKYWKLQLDLNFFSCKTVTETYVRHRNSGCCHYIKLLKLETKIF